MRAMRLRATRTLTVEPWLPPDLEPLRALARNLYWTWNTEAAALFERMDGAAWEQSGHNPVRLLQEAPRATLERLAGDHGFVMELQRVAGALQAYLARPPQLTIAGVS